MRHDTDARKSAPLSQNHFCVKITYCICSLLFFHRKIAGGPQARELAAGMVGGNFDPAGESEDGPANRSSADFLALAERFGYGAPFAGTPA
jgi:hypothetical protein